MKLRHSVGALLLTVFLFAIGLPAMGQNAASKGKGIELKGQITDPDGSPIAGATIQNQTENTYTSSDANGNYTLSVKNPQTATIVVSFLGMDTVTQALEGRSRLDVQMTTDGNFLEESVVTGYQAIQQRKVTGAIATIGVKTIEERYSPSLLQNLEGRVAGLSTYGGKLTIRGVSSMYAESSPLLVVDGLPIEGDIDDLNPYDIESVNVLKDAAAAAIYGARASNGIIVITTKNAREKGHIDVDFSANLTVYQKRNMDYGANFYMTPAQQVQVERDYYNYYFNTRKRFPIRSLPWRRSWPTAPAASLPSAMPTTCRPRAITPRARWTRFATNCPRIILPRNMPTPFTAARLCSSTTWPCAAAATSSRATS